MPPRPTHVLIKNPKKTHLRHIIYQVPSDALDSIMIPPSSQPTNQYIEPPPLNPRLISNHMVGYA